MSRYRGPKPDDPKAVAGLRQRLQEKRQAKAAVNFIADLEAFETSRRVAK